MAKLYGIGVGPGDPELLTLKAKRKIEEIETILVPGKIAMESMAYKIASQMIDFSKKKVIAYEMPMTKNKEEILKAHKKAEKLFIQILEEQRDIACLTLGDPCIYSTYMYIHNRMIQQGFQAEIINGIPSFCIAAARLGIGLCENKEQLHILPASYDLETTLGLSGTKVLMKAASQYEKVKELLFQRQEKDKISAIYMVENCGMENEKQYYSLEEMPEKAGYFSLIILKE